MQKKNKTGFSHINIKTDLQLNQDMQNPQKAQKQNRLKKR